MVAATITLVIVLAGAVYLRGWLNGPCLKSWQAEARPTWHRKLLIRKRGAGAFACELGDTRLLTLKGRSIPVWRACSFFLGLLLTWTPLVPLASADSHMLTAHMIQHLLLMTFAPPLIWLGEPLMTVRRWLVPKNLGRPLGHPVFCWLAATATLIVWHVPAIFQLGMESPTWHFIEHASFLISGLLFWWPVMQPWPSAALWPRWSMLLYLFLATLPCDVLSGLLVFSDRVVYPMYLTMPEMGPQMGALSPLADQECAAALMWTCVTVVFLVAGTILSVQILSPNHRIQEAV